MIWIIIEFLLYLFVLVYFLIDIVYSIKKIKYQKLWNKEKALQLRIDPAITRAELCELYVMFCIRNNCKVDY